MCKSILSNERFCLVCGTPENLHRHHIFGGYGLRDLSEKNGFWCYLCARHHNMSNHSVHADKTLDLKLKSKCQEIYELDHSREEFMDIIGRNYL